MLLLPSYYHWYGQGLQGFQNKRSLIENEVNAFYTNEQLSMPHSQTATSYKQNAICQSS